MKAVLLAAGEGSRLHPLTLTRPKHLIKICGKPLMEYCLSAVKLAGISEVLVVVHYMENAIRQYFGEGEKLGLKIEYVTQEAALGTGNAVSIIEPYIKEDFLLVYGDLFFSPHLPKNLLDVHQKEKPTATMAVVPVETPENYGIVETKDDKYVNRIIEKPARKEAPTNLANAGIYIFSKEIFDSVRKITASPREELEITDAITILAKEGKTVLAHKIPKDDWMDIGRPWDLLEANAWALKKMEHKIYGFIEKDTQIIGKVAIAENARIRSGAYIEGPAFIDHGSDIGPNCYIRPYTSIGSKVRIGNACEIKNSIIMDGTHIGHLSYVGDSILGENCNLGAGTIMANYRLDGGTIKMKIKDKVMDTRRRKLGAILGDNVKTGINALLMPGVKIGNNSWIGPNVVVYRDVPPDTKVLLRQSVEEEKLNP